MTVVGNFCMRSVIKITKALIFTASQFAIVDSRVMYAGSWKPLKINMNIPNIFVYHVIKRAKGIFLLRGCTERKCQNTYNLHRPARKLFHRNPYTVTKIDDVW
jgi:hypothetical protein